MSTVIVRPRARADLAEIWAYIANDSPDQADAFVDLIDSKFQALSRRPGLGRRRPELAPDVRSFPVGRHVVFYLPLSRGIEVVRVLHGSRDIESIFENEQQATGCHTACPELVEGWDSTTSSFLGFPCLCTARQSSRPLAAFQLT